MQENPANDNISQEVLMYDRLRRWFSTLSQYSKALYASFYSSVLYADVVKRWHGLGIGYLLFLIILGAIPLSGRVIIAFNHFFKGEILFPIQALPLLTIQNGEITYNQPMPYLIKNNRGEVVSIIDTTGTVSEMNQSYPQLTVLITKNKMILRPPSYKQFLGLAKDNIGNPIYTRTFDKGVNGLLSGAEWIQSTGISRLNTLMQILVFPCVTLFYFGVFGVMLLLLSALVQLYSDIFFSFKLQFKASCRLLAIAATPTLVLFFFMRCGNFSLPGMGLVYGVLILSYTSYGLYSVKRFRV
ncbi:MULTISPECIES: DUF1189 family protein [Legionella]|jgi:hypothetical protein|uniref:DUF1189 domain-containing protein n=1 Tax=Legionella drancourtii LLAP12 TaxID=658187 RepID=G9ELE4_9GAMM|nr:MULTISPECIES: DUF1189 family protein [Legionella]HAT9685511.1 DUF1189 domain-containing protein [Legionella pneumophila subsp. pneumophila]EHL31779.1 hypothetical protein LDG_5942 [Legionella drancourtii LLAP12]MBN9227998.1 DUF1189 family protein [Legionella steelei]CZH09544.1 Protein of uncharacterised function (DUF1189) [Legionella pneumophila]CZH44369.1 Protein of uncharacterised function (DUF1189) [Legionella pneumophila]